MSFVLCVIEKPHVIFDAAIRVLFPFFNDPSPDIVDLDVGDIRFYRLFEEAEGIISIGDDLRFCLFRNLSSRAVIV